MIRQSKATTVVRCDHFELARADTNESHRYCAEEFRSFAVPKVIPTQLAHAGWLVRKNSEGITQHFCRAHADRILRPMSWRLMQEKGD